MAQESELVAWIGGPPTHCDLCARPISRSFYDARTISGPWGILCPLCFPTHGVGIGLGYGQRFEFHPAMGQYLLVEGGDTRATDLT